MFLYFPLKIILDGLAILHYTKPIFQCSYDRSENIGRSNFTICQFSMGVVYLAQIT